MNVKKRQEIRTKTCTDTDKANILWSLHGIECAVISLFFFFVFYFFSFFLRVPAVGPAKYVNVAQVASFFSSRLLGNVCANEKKKETPTTYFIKKKNVPNECYSIRDSTAFSNWQQIPSHVSHFMTKLDNLLLDMFLLCFFSLDFRIKWWTIGWIPVYICRWSNVMPDKIRWNIIALANYMNNTKNSTTGQVKKRA